MCKRSLRVVTFLIFCVVSIDDITLHCLIQDFAEPPADLTKQALSSSSSTSSTPSNDSDQSDGRSEYSSVSSLSLASSVATPPRTSKHSSASLTKGRPKIIPIRNNFIGGIPGQGIPARQQARSCTPQYTKPPGYWRNVAGNTRMGRLPHLYKHGPKINNFTTQPRVFHSKPELDMTSSSEDDDDSSDDASTSSDSDS